MSPVVAVAVPADLRALFFPDDALSGLGEPRVAADGADLGAPEVLAELAGPADVLVTSWPCAAVTGAVLAASPSLRLVAHTGASVKPYVGLDAFERGVRVTQAGAAMARAVGEQAVALTLALLHRVHRFDSALRSGTPWTQAKVAPPRHELAGSAVGVVGASRTGRAYIELVRSLGEWSPSPTRTSPRRRPPRWACASPAWTTSCAARGCWRCTRRCCRRRGG